MTNIKECFYCDESATTECAVCKGDLCEGCAEQCDECGTTLCHSCEPLCSMCDEEVEFDNYDEYEED